MRAQRQLPRTSPHTSYRLPRGPRYSPKSWRIVDRLGRYLRTNEVPFSWTEREMVALSFRTEEAAKRFVTKHFVGPAAARELLGLRIV